MPKENKYEGKCTWVTEAFNAKILLVPQQSSVITTLMSSYKKMLSSGMWHHVIQQKFADVSEKSAVE